MDRLETYVIDDRGVPGDPPPRRVLFLLHGYDATEHDLTSLGPLVDPAGRYLVAGARGPVSTGVGGSAWFTSGPLGPDADTFHRSLAALHHTLDELCADRLLQRDEVVIGGFSQGAAMALALALDDPTRAAPAGVLCWSGFLVDVDGFTPAWTDRAGTPTLVQHGRLDETVPFELGRDTAHTLRHQGLDVSFHEYDSGHQVTIESLIDARSWLAALDRQDSDHDIAERDIAERDIADHEGRSAASTPRGRP
jgi:phospholipase/carboxylesterase